MTRLLLAVAALAVAATLAAPLASALLTEHAAFATSRNERNVAVAWDDAGGEIWAFARSRSGQPNRYDAYVKHAGNAAVKLNTKGKGWTGGVDFPLVVYQRLVNGASNIYLYDLTDGSRPATPTGVNTRKWEWHPTISGEWLLFGRNDNSFARQRVVLHNTTTGEERVLATVANDSYYLQPDRVRGKWATYTRCSPNCNVFLYDIEAGTKTTVPKPAVTSARHQYSGAVTDTGVVYLARSGRGCGSSVRIVRFDPGRDPATGTVIAALPRGRDIGMVDVLELSDGGAHVYYDRATCATGKFDIYYVIDPPPAP